MKTKDTEDKNRNPNTSQGQELIPEDRKITSFKKNPPDDNQKIPEWIDIGKILNRFRHVGDREHKAGEDNRRHQKEKGNHHCLLLGPG